MSERCPDKLTLQVLLETDSVATAELQGHLEACGHCRHTLELLAGDRGTWEGAMSLAEPYWNENALKELMGRLKEADTPLNDDQIMAMLEPSDTPGVLGKIDQYEVREVLGRGSMAVVFKAFDPAMNRIIGIKMLSPRLAHSPTAQQRFVREVRIAAAVRSEFVVPVYFVNEGRGLPYFGMEFVEGGTVQDRIERTGQLEIEEIIRIAYQTATGLAAAHKQGLIHRDIKPANLMLHGSNVNITDFGLARAVDDTDVTRDRVIIGTPEYMSPEQARGETLDQRSDLFSLGSVLYAMCTGKSPFRGESAVAVLRRVSDETPTPVQKLNPNVPDWLVSLIDRLMAKNRNDRIGTAKEVADLLQGYLAHLQTQTPAPHLPAAPRHNRLKGRGVVLMAATILLLAVFAALLVRSLPIDDWRLVAGILGGIFGLLATAAVAFVYWWPIRYDRDQSP
jgi:serine/threonine-protein kinase